MEYDLDREDVLPYDMVAAAYGALEASGHGTRFVLDGSKLARDLQEQVWALCNTTAGRLVDAVASVIGSTMREGAVVTMGYDRKNSHYILFVTPFPVDRADEVTYQQHNMLKLTIGRQSSLTDVSTNVVRAGMEGGSIMEEIDVCLRALGPWSPAMTAVTGVIADVILAHHTAMVWGDAVSFNLP